MSERVPLAALLGWPAGHSRSPALHNHWLRTLNLRGHYVPIDVAPPDLERILRTLPELGFVGCNVTIPHKVAVLELADIVTDRAALIGAANTIKFQTDGKVHADNTDGVGFIRALQIGAPDWDPRSGPAAVLGAGGAARGVLAALIEAGVPEIRLTNRSRAKAEGLRQEFGPKVAVTDWNRAGSIFDDAALAVNTTSLGMTGGSEMRVPLDGLQNAVAMDLVYTPIRTTFLEVAEAQGCTVVDGLGMLIHQAVPGFERWFGMRPPTDADARRAALGFGA